MPKKRRLNMSRPKGVIKVVGLALSSFRTIS